MVQRIVPPAVAADVVAAGPQRLLYKGLKGGRGRGRLELDALVLGSCQPGEDPEMMRLCRPTTATITAYHSVHKSEDATPPLVFPYRMFTTLISGRGVLVTQAATAVLCCTEQISTY